MTTDWCVACVTDTPQVAEVSTEVHRLSRCLSQASFPSSGPSQTDGDLGEHGNIKRVTDITLSCCDVFASLNATCSYLPSLQL